MSAQTRILRRAYTGNLSLKTTDRCRTTSLLPSFSPSSTRVSPNGKKLENGMFLCGLANALSSLECAEIIKNGDQCLFENMSDKYKFGKQRNSSRLLVLDEMLARNLWNNIKPVLSKEMEKLEILKQPLGFAVTIGEWELHGLNEAMRISKYSSANKEFFGPHKDAQYCPNGDQRSLFTLLVYLNDGFVGGETCFYFPKDVTQNTKGMTTQEEIDALGGLKDGFDCVKIVPKVGYAVLFSHNILHESLPVLTGTKYIVKTDVVVKRHSKKFGFAVENKEKDDYLACLNYFREAQQQELLANFLEASNLYERALSIRYCYPRSLQKAANVPVMNKDDDDECPSFRFPLSVWQRIFDFLSGPDAQSLVHAYPHLLATKQSWGTNERNRSGRKYIPKVSYQKGVITRFEFPDADFFSQNADGCCRVAAMYSFFLLGHKPEDDVYIVQYDPGTQTVCAVTLNAFLSDAFYNRQCHGSFYNVRQQDPKKKDPKKDLEACVDRNYMLLRHGAEFFGVELPDSFYAKSTAYPVSDHSDEELEGDEWEVEEEEEGEGEEEEEDEEGKKEAATIKQVNVFEEKITPKEICDGSVPFYDDDDIGQPFRVEHLVRLFIICSTPDNFELDEMIDGMEKNGDVVFFNAVKDIVAGSPSVSCALVSKLKETLDIGVDEACICPLGPNYELFKRTGDSCTTEFYNHLVFDFHEAQLSVKCDDITEDELFSPCHFESISDEQKTIGCTGEPIFYRVHIGPILSPADSFNHASCQCAHPRFEIHEYYNLKDYPYLTDVHLVARELDGKMLLWSVYCGVVAL